MTGEEQISEPENRMMEITATEKNSEKELKEIRRVSDTSRATLSAPTFKLYGFEFSEEEKKVKNSEKIFEETVFKIP